MLLSDNEVLYDLDRNLSEAVSGVDFNGDWDQTDTFTSHIRGVVWANNKFYGLQYGGGTTIVRFTGAVITKEMFLWGAGCIFEQDPNLAVNPVVGFVGDGMRLLKGSFRIE